MNYIYTLEQRYTVTTYRKESCSHLHRHTPIFVNFNIEYSMFYAPQNTLFSKIMFYPLFTVHLCIYI